MRASTIAYLIFAFFANSYAVAQDQLNASPEAASTETKTAECKPEVVEYLRIRRSDSGQPLALETAIAKFVSGPQAKYPGIEVDLVGAVHIAENAYYRSLNKRFRSYDSVLYELVAEEGTRVTPEQANAGRSPVSALQVGMKDLLELDFQLEKIDYQAKNFKHADMTPAEFAEDMKDRGDSMLQTMFRMMGAGLAMQASGKGGDAGLLLALLAPDRSRQLRRAMAKQFQDLEATTIGMSAEDGRSTIITERNAKAFKVLSTELDAGKRKIAVFYGAGHLPDMGQRLVRDFGLVPVPDKTEYLEAWDLR
jgi:hypothetical protein